MTCTLLSRSPDRLAQELRLRREQHVVYLTKSLGALSGSYVSLDASRPWIVFWCLHGLALVGAPAAILAALRSWNTAHDAGGQLDPLHCKEFLPPSSPSPPPPYQLGVEATSLETPSTEAIVEFLSQCQHPEGGFGGGPGQLAHTATTYAALAALVTVGGPGALGSIGRESLMAFLTRMCVEDGEGGMRVHEGGEVDIRACYTAVAAAALAGLDVGELGRRGRVAAYVAAGQTGEGGLGGEPGNEAHGAYTYCGLACLALLGEAGRLDLRALAQWCVRQQGGVEGGFRGRTNKLVDGCYSFWQGALMPLLQRVWPETAAQGGVPRGPGLQGDAARAARAWAAAEAVLCDAPLGEVGADVQAENHLMWVAGERAARGHASAAPPADADAVRRAQEDVTVADSMAPEVFAQCAVHCSTREGPGLPSVVALATRCSSR